MILEENYRVTGNVYSNCFSWNYFLLYVIVTARKLSSVNFALHDIIVTATLRLHLFLFTLHCIETSGREILCDSVH